MTTSSLDRNQKIWITPESRKELFAQVTEDLKEGCTLREAFSAEQLERYCCGATHLPDYAYSHIRVLLKKEYKDAISQVC